MNTTLPPEGVADIRILTSRLAKTAWVEVVCVDHYDNPDLHCKTVNIHGPGHDHKCHCCNGYRLMKATTPQKKQVCDNCYGPVRWSGESSCFPDLLLVNDFIDPADHRPTWVQRQTGEENE